MNNSETNLVEVEFLKTMACFPNLDRNVRLQFSDNESKVALLFEEFQRVDIACKEAILTYRQSKGWRQRLNAHRLHKSVKKVAQIKDQFRKLTILQLRSSIKTPDRIHMLSGKSFRPVKKDELNSLIEIAINAYGQALSLIGPNISFRNVPITCFR